MKKKGLNMEQKRSLTGWAFLLPAALLIFVFCFYPMVQALILSFQKGTGSAVQPAGFANYVRILKDATFQQCLFNTIFYFVIQVPIMLILALILAQLLNSPDIKGKGIYRTMIFLPCATSLVSYSMIFKSLFANDGLVNRVLSTVGIPTVDWFQNAWAARWVIVIALVWRWTGYNMVFYLAGLQNIDYSIYEAARIDGAGAMHIMWCIYVPLALPCIATIALFSFVGHWNAWFDAAIYMESQSKIPLQTYIQQLVVESSVSSSLSPQEQMMLAEVSGKSFNAAKVFVTMLPLLLIYPFVQRYFVQGIVIGSVKE